MDLLPPGAHVGDARIVRVLGSGSVATVYEALHEGARRAVKVVGGTVVDASSTVQRRLAQEGEAMAMIEHVNVVRWYDSGVDDTRIWIVLELVEGKNLRELLRAAGGKLKVERAVAILRQACEGLAAVHKKGIVHRDMKPENVLVTSDGEQAKVADFGSAKLPGWGVKTTNNALPLTSMLYAPPEKWRGASLDPRGDVYAMGVILYEAIAGEHPIAPLDADVRTICERVLTYEPPPLVTRVPNVPGDLSDLVQRAMAKDPARRPTMRELADALEVVLDRLLVWRRAAARSVPLPNRESVLAATTPMLAYPSSSPQPAPVSTAPTGRGPGGTIQMPAVSSPRSPVGTGRSILEPADEPREPDREALPPPPPPSSVPATLRSRSRPAPAPLAAAAPEPEKARRSTGIPVESIAHPTTGMPARRTTRVLVACGALLVLAAAVWWTLSGPAPRPAPASAPPPSASVTPPTSASVPKPPPSATAPRRPSMPGPRKPHR